MEGKNQSASLEDERGKTNTSLTCERGKTDDSLAKNRKLTETDTNELVEHDRKDSDEARAKSRKTVDAATDVKRFGRTKLSNNRTPSEVKADDSLSKQRDRDDATVVTERSAMDTALELERDAKKAGSTKFLEAERKETDRNLSHERAHTDSEALVSSILLHSELSSHKVTKDALTSRDEFLEFVSRDLRNPIEAVLSYSRLMLSDTPRSETTARSWAEAIEQNAEKSLRLIGYIVDIEKLATGKLSLKFAPQDIDKMIEETMTDFLHVALEKKIAFTSAFEGPNLPVSCDRERIQQVLANLIGNALKYTPQGGSVTVTSYQNDKELRISVADTGCGVPAEQMKRIFDRYTHLENEKRQGLGLGLYISKIFVEAHQGKMGLISTLEKGSTFSLTMPIRRSTPIGGLL